MFDDEDWNIPIQPPPGASKGYTPKVAIRDINLTMRLIQDIRFNYTSLFLKAEDFFRSVYGGLAATRTTIRLNDNVTAAQEKAIKNWNSGVCAWHPDYR
jgi:hypothetical protein